MYAVVLLAVTVASLGCHKPTPESYRVSQAFAAASGNIQAQWHNIVAADITNDYATVMVDGRILLCDKTLTSEQRTALLGIVNGVSDRMFAAVRKGDPAARAALYKVRHER
jgi:hypothetical protein